MNAKSERASVPDRVEAAALHPHTLEMIEGRARSALDATLSPELALSVVRRDVPVLIAEVRRLAAADACEAERAAELAHELNGTSGIVDPPTPANIAHAKRVTAAAWPEALAEAERNPNPTDELMQVGWCWPNPLIEDAWFFMTFDGAPPPPRNGLRPVYARRAVSSEDVHREAAE